MGFDRVSVLGSLRFGPKAFSGVAYSSFTIKIPAGQSVGVDIEAFKARNRMVI